jgi:glycosyltransferase involved in cell wall biosynthesis
VSEAAGKSSTPRVAFLVKRFPRLSETFVLNEFLELRRQGVPLRLVALMDPAEAQVQPESAALIPEVTYLRGPSWWPLIPRLLRIALRHRRGTLSALGWVISRRRLASWRRLGEALLLVDELEGETVHLHVHWAHAPAGTAILAHRIAGIPWSLTTHAKDLYTMPVSDIAERCAQAKFVATCTAANAAYLTDAVGVDPAKVVLCRHGVRFDRFDADDRRPEPGRLLAVGRLVPKKGLGVLIEACVLLAARAVDFTLDIVGDGPSAGVLAHQVAAGGLGERVTFHEARPQPELVAFYVRAAVFTLVPTVQTNGDRDGVPNVILEAMACGVPVVASAISGIPEVVEHDRTGLLVPPSDASALADALERLLGCPAEADALGRAGAQAVRASFDIAGCVAPLAELLRARLAAAGDTVGAPT